ncbi:uncharacterized protein EDB93DRAFT_536596 [Suillus bovinus]|uniref:uncharacterized protein n=1 Tax=Suillus bovinus TaxID=48563 RepID=UPI001B861142|nr:uncharacterized protein EDB93DRAFT_536596 [Suillus bovinus]KAG2144370.1 hypothetical protein EDB93DRAFT_536596 [Suillus bovinus]
MGNEHTAKPNGGGTLTHWNINYAFAYKRQDNGLTSSSYPASSTAPNSAPTDSPTDVVASASTAANANIATVISITALPPLDTTLPHNVTKVSYHQHLDVIFLAPLFAVLGILLGVGAMSLWWRLRRLGDAGSGVCGLGGRNTGGGSRISLEPGPAYAPAPADEGDGGIDFAEGPGPYSTRNGSTEEVALFAAGTPSKTTVHGTRYLFPTHMRDQATIGGTVTKPLCTPFLVGASQFDSAGTGTGTGTGDSDHGDPFTWAHNASSSRAYDAERAEADHSRRSMFQRILNRSTSFNGRQYSAVRTRDLSPSKHHFNSIPTLALNVDLANTTTSHGGRSSAVDVPLRSFEGGAGSEVQRPVRAWLETPERTVQTPEGTRYGNGRSDKCKVTGDQHPDYAPMTETPRTPVSKVSQFWTPRWKNKVLPLLSSQSPAKPSPFPPCIVPSPSQSPSPMPRHAVSISTHERSSKERKQQDLFEKRTESGPKLQERNTSIPQIDSSVLPRNPPLLMSPPLEAALLFTSTSCGTLSFATLANLSPKLVSRSPPTSKAKVFAGAFDGPLISKPKAKANLGSPKILNINQSAHVTSPDISLFPLPSSAKKLKKRKSQSRSRKGKQQVTNKWTETSPMLPLPSYPDHLVYAGLKTSVSMTLASSPSQPTISPTPTMLAILAATQSLERVNEILMRGYSERALGGGDMGGDERVLRESIVVAGIEESS